MSTENHGAFVQEISFSIPGVAYKKKLVQPYLYKRFSVHFPNREVALYMCANDTSH